MTPTEREAFEVFAQKAHVGCPGARHKAYRAWQMFSAALTEKEALELGVAWSHAHSNEGPEELFDVIKKIRRERKLDG